MDRPITVKARFRTGTSSLDLTIPAKLVEEYKIEPGAVFVVEAQQNGALILTYKKIYPK